MSGSGIAYREGMVKREAVTIFAETNHRGKRVQFGIYNSDRRYHMAVIDRTGMGKTTLMEALISSDITDGNRRALPGLTAISLNLCLLHRFYYAPLDDHTEREWDI